MKLKLALFAILVIMVGLFAGETFVFEKQFNGSGGWGDKQFNFSSPTAVAIADNDEIYVADSLEGAVYVINSLDQVVRVIGKEGGKSDFSIISDVLIADDHIYILDRGSSRVYEYILGSGIFAVGPPRDLLSEPTAMWVEN